MKCVLESRIHSAQQRYLVIEHDYLALFDLGTELDDSNYWCLFSDFWTRILVFLLLKSSQVIYRAEMLDDSPPLKPRKFITMRSV